MTHVPSGVTPRQRRTARRRQALVAVLAGLTLGSTGALVAPPGAAAAPGVGAGAQPQAAPPVAGAQPTAAGRAGGRTTYLVETTSARAATRVEKRAEAVGGRVTRRYTTVLHGFAATLTTAQARGLRARAGVRTVVRDRAIAADACRGCLPEALTRTQVTNWGLLRLSSRTPVTLEPQEPDGPLYRYDSDGEGVTAFVLDSGITAGGELAADRVRPGRDFVGGGAATDCGGHGTTVAQVIGGNVTGVADEVSLVPLRVFDCNGQGRWSNVIAALDWAVTHQPDGPAVLNLSGSSKGFALADRAVRRTVARGLPVVASAGNASANACRYSPARVPAVLTVAATDIDDRLAPSSNAGPCVDLLAPGVDVVTTAGTVSGTSVAAAHVSGAVARYLENHRSAGPARVAAYLRGQATTGAVAARRGAPDRLLFLPEPVPPGAPTDVSWTVDQEANTVTATWSPPTTRGSGRLLEYLVCTQPIDVFTQFPGPVCSSAPLSARTLTVGGGRDSLYLEDNGSYGFFVATVSKAGSTATATTELRLGQAPPADPTVTVSLQTGGILVQAASNDAPWNGYLEYTYTRTGPDADGVAFVTETTTSDAVFYNKLIDGQTYTFTVQARNSAGISGVVTKVIDYRDIVIPQGRRSTGTRPTR